ncbi:rRNA methyltransferase-like protein [Hapsidospora chrysogenum ATCC 11550]|uniref:rRNA methyltransferase 1, mitochondrial n=1 Tax=Hapsidospora chrysogenum (strain ATCC 11550 / CBS 779.69 / DSM 880 / IAM 14645 / JCM 23072 / IMI 49137) TaxID=857340 RepID=A0A086T5Y7_HAPC1|nr:rRNA methyltransferase-like protein [Hapsidospora chrysogenum ATCC 11550]
MIRSLQLQAFGLRRPSSRILAQPSFTIPAATRPASLSAIHRGLRRSEKAQYGESRHSAAKPSELAPRRRRGDDDYVARTEKALEGAASKRQRAKLLSKLKRKEEERDGTGKQTRRKRFVDPSSNFGKDSLVYQLKHGSLKDLTKIIDEPVRPRSFREKRWEDRPPRDATAGRASPSGPGDRAEGHRQRPRPRSSDEAQDREDKFREAFASRHSASDSGDRARGGKEGLGGRRSSRPRDRGDRDSSTGRTPRSDDINRGARGRDDRDAERTDRRQGRVDEVDGVSTPAPRPRMGNMMPITIKYTTAASQFLYGRSVVKAALEQGRRKLYNLYTYGGENRQETKDVLAIQQLAKKRGVPITVVPSEDQRLMDKMSMGRPHNGFVLETSPLPQLPVASLGKLEESASRLGFNVELDYQTREEEAVNGTDTFIPRSSNVAARPLVLLLNEIMDPGNLGAMLRTASYLGVDAVGITNRGSSNLSPVVLKSAAGAVEEVTIFTVDSPVKFIEESKRAGWKSYAAVAPPSKKLTAMHSGKFVSTEDIERASPLSENPCILILGNEGHGLSKQVKMAADYELSVPRFIQGSCVDSLNVSVAAGLLCHAFIKEPTTRRESQPKKLADVATAEESNEPQEKVGKTEDKVDGYMF